MGMLDWFLGADPPRVRQPVAVRQNSLNALKGLSGKIRLGTGLD